MEIVTLIIGIIVGIAAAYLLLGKKADEAARLARSEGQVELARLTERLDAEKRLGAEKIALLTEAKEELSNQFKALASDILEDKSKRFTEQNQTNISQLLEPLKVKLTEFKGKVEEVYFLRGQVLQNHHGGLVLVGDYVYGGHGHNAGFPFCLNFSTGQFAWKPVRGSGDGSAAVVYADGHLYFRYQNGVMALIEATPEGYREKGHFDLPLPHGTPSWPHPVVVHGRLYLRGPDTLLCYDVKRR